MKKYMVFAGLMCFMGSTAIAQKSWKPFAGLHISSSADGYYVGPSFSAGVSRTLGKKQKWSWTPELTFFYNSSTYQHTSTLSEKDKFISYSIRSNFNYQAGKKQGKGFFMGAGFGFQRASDECWSITQNGSVKEVNVHYDAIKYGILTATFNAGYTFPVKKNKSLQAVISATGPHQAKDYLGTYVEAISVLSAGVRFVL